MWEAQGSIPSTAIIKQQQQKGLKLFLKFIKFIEGAPS
jgi:hypothetical protein